MEYNGVKFDAIVASPGCGKSYVCDRREKFIDVDEVRLRARYIVPENITREELERTKGNRDFQKRDNYKQTLYAEIEKYLKQNKTLIAAPHPEVIDYFLKNDIKYCFVYPSMDCKPLMIQRWKERGNSKEFIESNEKNFDMWYQQNISDTQATCHYKLLPNEFLSDVIIKFKETLE